MLATRARMAAANTNTGESPAFIFTVKTDNAGTSANDQFTLPMVSGESYDFNVDWGDGTDDDVSGSSLTAETHTYAGGAGTYTVTITGTFPRIYFNNGGDKLKLLTIENWGDVSWSADQEGAFYGCGNLTALPDDHVDFWNSTLTNGTQMFRDNSLTSLPSGMTLAALIDGTLMFYNNNLTSLPSGMTLAALTNGTQMFFDNSLASLPSGMTLAALTDGSSMFRDNSLTSLPSGMTLAALTDGSSMFRDNSLTSLPSGMTLAALTNGLRMFFDNSLTSLPSGMTLAALTNGSQMFFDNSLTSLPSGMTLAALTNGSQMFFGNTIATADYSGLLVNIEANNSNNSVNFHGGNSTYNPTGGTARAALIADHSWTITDGGAA